MRKFILFQGSLHMYNFSLDTTLFPTYFMTDDLKLCMLTKLTGKIPNSKGFVHLFTVKAYGKIIKN